MLGHHALSFASLLALSLAATACSHAAEVPVQTSEVTLTSAAPAIAWPALKGWRGESFRFPLEFAPALPYAGSEELRFMPGFGRPKEAGYFSYSFVWILDGAPEPAADSLAADLKVYFSGLANAVDAAHFDARVHSARFSRSPGGFQGTVSTVDAFNGSRALDLNVDVSSTLCGKRRVLLFDVSPRPREDGVWKELAAQRGTFQCTSRA